MNKVGIIHPVAYAIGSMATQHFFAGNPDYAMEALHLLMFLAFLEGVKLASGKRRKRTKHWQHPVCRYVAVVRIERVLQPVQRTPGAVQIHDDAPVVQAWPVHVEVKCCCHNKSVASLRFGLIPEAVERASKSPCESLYFCAPEGLMGVRTVQSDQVFARALELIRAWDPNSKNWPKIPQRMN